MGSKDDMTKHMTLHEKITIHEDGSQTKTSVVFTPNSHMHQMLGMLKTLVLQQEEQISRGSVDETGAINKKIINLVDDIIEEYSESEREIIKEMAGMFDDTSNEGD
jgi:hypothetical protein